MDADVELDCRGMLCPLPVIRLANHLGRPRRRRSRWRWWPRTRRPGPTSPAWCRMRGQEYVGEDLADDGVPRFVVRRLR